MSTKNLLHKTNKKELPEPPAVPVYWTVTGKFVKVKKKVKAKLAMDAWEKAQLRDKENVLIHFSEVTCKLV